MFREIDPESDNGSSHRERSCRTASRIQKIPGDARPPLSEAGHRVKFRVGGFIEVVHQIAIGPMLDLVAERISPIVENLAAFDVPADAPTLASYHNNRFKVLLSFFLRNHSPPVMRFSQSFATFGA